MAVLVKGFGGGETAKKLLEKIKTVDGSGSGLDADLLDGKEASAFAATEHTHAATDLSGIVAIENGGTGYNTIEDTTYTTARYRASALYNVDTAPTVNGVINWTYA